MDGRVSSALRDLRRVASSCTVNSRTRSIEAGRVRPGGSPFVAPREPARPTGCTRSRWPPGGERVCQWNSGTVAPSARRIRQQIEEGFDNIDVIDDEIRGIVDWPHPQG